MFFLIKKKNLDVFIFHGLLEDTPCPCPTLETGFGSQGSHCQCVRATEVGYLASAPSPCSCWADPGRWDCVSGLIPPARSTAHQRIPLMASLVFRFCGEKDAGHSRSEESRTSADCWHRPRLLLRARLLLHAGSLPRCQALGGSRAFTGHRVPERPSQGFPFTSTQGKDHLRKDSRRP